MSVINYFTVSFFLGGIVCYLSAVWVFLKNTRSRLNRSWFFLGTAAGTWSMGHFLMAMTRDYSLAWKFCYLLYASAILIPPLYMYFTFSLINKVKQRKKELVLAFAGSAIFLFLLPTKLFMRDVLPKSIFRYYDDPGPLCLVFLLFFMLIPLYSLGTLLAESKKKGGLRFLQLQYVAVASVVGFIGGGSTFLLAFNIPVPPYPLILFVFYPLIITFAIVRYRLMDINVAITRTSIFVFVYTLVLGLPFVLSTSGKATLIRFLGSLWWLAPLVLMAFLGTVGPFVYIYLKNRAEAILLREQRRYHAALKNAAVDLTRIRSLQKLLDFIVETIAESVKITHTAVYFFNEKSNCFILKSGVRFPSGLPGSILKENPLITWLQKNKESLVYEELKRKSEEDSDPAVIKLEKQLKSLNAAVVVPCFLEKRLLDIIIIGDKLSGDFYTQEDIDNFTALAAEAALATENAQLYEKIENEVKERTQELVQTQKQLVQAEKLATMGTLAGGVAHEINNPLTAILTNAQILLETGQYDKESLEMIEEATKRCRTIVQKLMAYAKKPAEATMVYEMDLRDVVANAVSFLKFQLEQENITAEILASEKAYQVKGNHNELEQVITNLVLNAKDAIRKVKKNGRIDLVLSENENWVTLSIQDEGAGIPAAIMGRIFDPFFTTKDVGKGLGLGLSICQSIIDKHKGKIAVESKENKGSTFTVYLPRQA